MSIRPLAWCLLLLLPAIAGAQEKGAACRADVEKYCAQSKAGPKAAMDCLLDHQQDISDACYDSLKQRMERQSGFQACRQDADKYCGGTQAGGGRIMRCLADHQKEVSDACYELLSKRAKGGRQ